MLVVETGFLPLFLRSHFDRESGIPAFPSSWLLEDRFDWTA